MFARSSGDPSLAIQRSSPKTPGARRRRHSDLLEAGSCRWYPPAPRVSQRSRPRRRRRRSPRRRPATARGVACVGRPVPRCRVKTFWGSARGRTSGGGRSAWVEALGRLIRAEGCWLGCEFAGARGGGADRLGCRRPFVRLRRQAARRRQSTRVPREVLSAEVPVGVCSRSAVIASSASSTSSKSR